MNFIKSFRNSWALKKIGLGYKDEVTIPPVHVTSNKFTSFLEPYESQLIKLQTLLIWDNALHSAIFFAVFNVLYWFSVIFEHLFYFIFSLLIPGFLLRHIWRNYIWPEIKVPEEGDDKPHFSDEWLELNPRVYSVHEIGDGLQKAYETCYTLGDWYIQQWKQRSTILVGGASVTSLLLFIVFCYIRPAYLSFYVLNIIMVIPGVYLFCLKPFKDRIIHYLNIIKEIVQNRLCIGSGENSPDEFKDFIPESGSEEAAAALSVPLLASDPPAVVAALTQREAKNKKRGKKGTKASSSKGLSPNDFSFNEPHSLTPDVAAVGDLPSVTDSSEDEDEFVKGLMFDSNIQQKSNDGLLFNDPKLTADATDAKNNISILAGLLTQYPGAGQEILSNIGQNIISHLRSQVGESDRPTAHLTEDFTDDEMYEDESLEMRARKRHNQRRQIPDRDEFEFISDDEM